MGQTYTHLIPDADTAPKETVILCETDNETDAENNVMYVLTIQSSKSHYFEDGINALTVLGNFRSLADASSAAKYISTSLPEYNLFIYRQQCGIKLNPVYSEYCAIEKWRYGDTLNDEDVCTESTFTIKNDGIDTLISGMTNTNSVDNSVNNADANN